MKVVHLESNRLQEFINYCRDNRYEHDESFLSEKELEEFEIKDNPTVLLTDDKDTVIGAASIMLSQQFRDNRKGRIRILHSSIASVEVYQSMLEPLVKDTKNIDYIYGFLPEARESSREIFEKLGFGVERYAWELKIPSDAGKPPAFPDGFRTEAFVEGRDEVAWCTIINEAFKNLAGHMPMTPEEIKINKDDEEYLENGKILLWDQNKAVGLINIAKEAAEEGVIAFIGPIGVLPEYQGKGLGRNLLRMGIELARKSGIDNTVLTVNAENSKAADLYLSEGFKKVAVFVCYRKRL